MSSVLNLFAIINPFFSIAMELAPYKSSIYWTVLIVAVIFSIFTIIFLVNYKRTANNTLKLLNVLSQNNKLHVLRELIMVASKRSKYSLDDYKFSISKAKFSYEVLKVEKSHTYTVKYKIELEVRVSWLEKLFLSIKCAIKRKGLQIKFYAICEKANPENFVAKLLNTTKSTVKMELATLSGESNDRSGEFSGLYEISNFPIDIDMINKHKKIMATIAYTAFEQIVKGEEQYTFVIIPLNYGRNIDEIEIAITGEVKGEPALQKFSHTEPHFKDQEYIFELQEDKEYCVSFCPDKNCVYVAQIGLEVEGKN